MGNFVIITTAVLFRIVLRRPLSKIQWASLVILFLSIMSLSNMNQTDHHHHHHHHHHQVIFHQNQNQNSPYQHKAVTYNSTVEAPPIISKFYINEGHILVLVQCALSSLANIYNEKIFKEDDGMKQSIYVQNSKLYFFGIIFNFFTLVIKPDFHRHLFECGFFSGYNIQSTILIFVTAFFGLVVALILKFRDNMFQVMSFQLSNVFIITSSVLFFDFHPTLEFFLVAPIVLLAIFIFNAGKNGNTLRQNDQDNGYTYFPLATK
ncbi:putative UDP-sugar transporter protein SLC35A5 [Exaiptasia diaphana]|nr:putative UDP-sugar transporter protein SLC35A5 [Exaiptasia diaphana]